jgi:hypothetical protein
MEVAALATLMEWVKAKEKLKGWRMNLDLVKELELGQS